MKTLPEDVNTMIGYKSTKLSTKFPVKCKTDFQYKNNVVFFFYQDFLSQTLAIHRTAREGRGPPFIPLYHFHLLMNIETFICNFACEMTITHF